MSAESWVLIIDNEKHWTKTIKETLARDVPALGDAVDRCECCGSPAAAIEMLRNNLNRLDALRLVVLDMHMPPGDGCVAWHRGGIAYLAALRVFLEIAPAAPVVVFTAYASFSDALELGRLGAAAYVAKDAGAVGLLERGYEGFTDAVRRVLSSRDEEIALSDERIMAAGGQPAGNWVAVRGNAERPYDGEDVPPLVASTKLELLDKIIATPSVLCGELRIIHTVVGQ